MLVVDPPLRQIGNGPSCIPQAPSQIHVLADMHFVFEAACVQESRPSHQEVTAWEIKCVVPAAAGAFAVMSSISLRNPARPGTSGDDTFYLPSCNLLVRRSAFLNAGGFKDEMHVGEDVDLTWRLRDAGWTITYLPQGRVYHEHRSTVRSFVSRRFDYGTSEGMLQRLHPQRRKRMVIPPLLALLLALCLSAPFTGWWSLLPALAVLVADAVIVRHRLASRGIPIGLPALLRGRVRALCSLVYYLSFHLVRYYS